MNQLPLPTTNLLNLTHTTAGSWCSCYERRPHVRLTVLGNGPRRANGAWALDTETLETFRCHREATPLTKPPSCDPSSAFTRVTACTLARSPYVVTVSAAE